MAKPKEPRLEDLFSPIMSEVIRILMLRANVRSQAALARLLGAPFDANTISRYKNGTVALKNLTIMGNRVGLTPGQIAWMIGKLLQDENEEHRFDFESAQPSEVREPQLPYGHRSPEDELAAVMELDFSVLKAEQMFDLTREKNLLHEDYGDLQKEIKASEERFARKKERLRKQLFLLRTRAEEMIREALGRR